MTEIPVWNFPSFSEGLSLRPYGGIYTIHREAGFPFLFGGTFIEANRCEPAPFSARTISLPFRRDFH